MHTLFAAAANLFAFSRLTSPIQFFVVWLATGLSKVKLWCFCSQTSAIA